MKATGKILIKTKKIIRIIICRGVRQYPMFTAPSVDADGALNTQADTTEY